MSKAYKRESRCTRLRFGRGAFVHVNNDDWGIMFCCYYFPKEKPCYCGVFEIMMYTPLKESTNTVLDELRITYGCTARRSAVRRAVQRAIGYGIYTGRAPKRH